MPSLAKALCTWVFTVWGDRFSWVATSRLVAPCAMRLMTLSSESVRLSQPVFARGWLTMRRSTPNPRSARPTRRASAVAPHSM